MSTDGSTNPFGKYAEALAAVVALSIIVCWLVGLLFNQQAVSQTLDNAAWACLGYIFARPVAAATAGKNQSDAKAAALTEKINAAETNVPTT